MSRHVSTQFWKVPARSTRLDSTRYSDFTFLFKIPSFIAEMEICDIFVLARLISSRAFSVALHHVWTAMRLFCLTIIRERDTLFASPIIVVYNCINVRRFNSLLII